MKMILHTSSMAEYIDMIHKLRKAKIFYISSINSTKSYTNNSPYCYRPGYYSSTESIGEYTYSIWASKIPL